MVYDGEFFWATTTRTSIIKWNLNKPFPIKEYQAPKNHPRGIGWEGKQIWTSDEGEYGRNRLYQHAADGTVTKTICPASEIENYEFHPFVIEYMDFDENGDLWTIGFDADNSRRIFKLSLD